MKRIQRNCETCGGPLSVSSTNKRIVCQYCGSIYEADEFIEIKIEPELPIIPPASISTVQDQPVYYSSRTNKTKAIIPIIVIIAIIGFFILIVTFSFRKNLSVKGNLNNSVPVMYEVLPKGEYVGNSIPYKDWELIVSPEIYVDGNSIGLNLTIKNWTDTKGVFRFRPNNIILYDDLGNNYPIRFGNCNEDEAYFEKQVSFNAFESKALTSDDYWCGDNNYLPLFFGTIPTDAKNLYLQFVEFGVYYKITFVFDL